MAWNDWQAQGHKQPQRGRHAPTRAHNGTSQNGLCTCARPSPPPVLIGPSCGLSWACSCQVEPRGPSQELLGAGSSWQEGLSLPVSLEPERDLTCSQSWGEPALCPHHPPGAGELSSGQSLEASLLGCCCFPGQGSTFTALPRSSPLPTFGAGLPLAAHSCRPCSPKSEAILTQFYSQPHLPQPPLNQEMDQAPQNTPRFSLPPEWPGRAWACPVGSELPQPSLLPRASSWRRLPVVRETPACLGGRNRCQRR